MNTRVTVVMTDELKSKLERLAKKSGLKVGTYIRYLATQEVERAEARENQNSNVI